MTDIGPILLLIALMATGYAAVVSLLGVKTGRKEMIKSAEYAIYAICVVTGIALGLLIYAFLTNNYQIEYVAAYSNRALPLLYKSTAFYAGQEGSLLFWAWVLSFMGVLVLWQNKNRNRELMPYVIAIMMGVQFFFLFIAIFVTNPFKMLPFVPEDGQGLNPLLQNYGMLGHPPTLYLGYVGFTVPFAFAMAALITGQLNDIWIRTTRKWTIFSWFFLGVGIVFGGQWAYMELGWGGYWMWDPVENASFMPWLTATAFLHSVMIQEKKDMLKVWNMVLIILTFTLSLLGTFLTRSGILSSVHAFGQSALGSYFLAFIGIVLVSSFSLLSSKLPLLRSKNELDSFVSRESTFLLNNLILVALTFTVFWGTFFPVISEAVRGVKVTVGPPFYNQVAVPIFMLLLLLTGLCPLIAWRRASKKNLSKNFLYPFVTAIVGTGIIFAAGVRADHPWTLAALGLCIFVFSTILYDVYRGTRMRVQMAKENYVTAFVNLLWNNKRRYGGYIIHTGVVIMFAAIALTTAYKVEKEVTLKTGESTMIGRYTLRYDDFNYYPTANREKYVATMAVFEKGEQTGYISPEKAIYFKQEQPTTEVALKWDLKEDLYVILAGFEESGLATFKVIINPVMVWLWIGGLVITFGTFVVMWPDKREAKQLAARYAKEAIESEV
jgi:cytochrome c-type biogenesis protein CcmF